MKITNQAKPHGAIKILWEGLKLPTTNFPHLLLPILLLNFLSSSLLFLFNHDCVTPVVADLTKKWLLVGKIDPNSPDFSVFIRAIRKDLKEVADVGLVELTVSFTANSLLAMAYTVLAITTIYTSKNPTKLNELLLKLNWSTFRGAMITQLYVALLQLGCMILLMLSVAVLYFFFYMSYSSFQSTIVIVVGVFSGLVAIRLYLYLFAVFKTSVVLSLADSKHYGMEAINKAGKLVRERRKQAIIVVLVESAAGALVYGAYNLATVHALLTEEGALADGLVQVNMLVVIDMLVWSVHTVFYYECSKSHGDWIPKEASFNYAAVPSKVDEALL